LEPFLNLGSLRLQRTVTPLLRVTLQRRAFVNSICGPGLRFTRLKAIAVLLFAKPSCSCQKTLADSNLRIIEGSQGRRPKTIISKKWRRSEYLENRQATEPWS